MTRKLFPDMTEKRILETINEEAIALIKKRIGAKHPDIPEIAKILEYEEDTDDQMKYDLMKQFEKILDMAIMMKLPLALCDFSIETQLNEETSQYELSVQTSIVVEIETVDNTSEIGETTIVRRIGVIEPDGKAKFDKIFICDVQEDGDHVFLKTRTK